MVGRLQLRFLEGLSERKTIERLGCDELSVVPDLCLIALLAVLAFDFLDTLVPCHCHRTLHAKDSEAPGTYPAPNGSFRVGFRI